MTVPVRISSVQIPIRKRRPTVRKLMVWYPIIYPSSWIDFLLAKHSYLLLGGLDLKTQATQWQQLLSDFWIKYKAYDPLHVMNQPGSPPGYLTIPIYLHGDEGRGKYKLPVMVEAFQGCISYKGTSFKNSSGPLVLFSYPLILQSSGLLYSCIMGNFQFQQSLLYKHIQGIPIAPASSLQSFLLSFTGVMLH